MPVFSFCWLVLPFRERNNFIRLSLKHIIVLYLQIFNTQNYIFFKISASGLFLKHFLKFRKFQPRYSYKIYSNRKKKECNWKADDRKKTPYTARNNVEPPHVARLTFILNKTLLNHTDQSQRRCPKLKMREDERVAKHDLCYQACCVTRLSIYRLCMGNSLSLSKC